MLSMQSTLLPSSKGCRKPAFVQVSIDLASFEVVQNCFTELEKLLRSRSFDLVLCNEEEAGAIAKVWAYKWLPPAVLFCAVL